MSMVSKPLGAVNLVGRFQELGRRDLRRYQNIKPELKGGRPQKLTDKRLFQAKRYPLF